MQHSNFKDARSDLIEGLIRAPIWWGLAWQETKQRYRRSIIGPFWISASTAIHVLAMGPLYGHLFGENIPLYIQYLSVSVIIWVFISGGLNQAGGTFTLVEGLIKQIALPFTVHILRVLAKALIEFLHNLIVIGFILLFLPPASLGGLWILPLAILIVLGNMFWLTALIAILSARFRDVPQIVASIVQVLFFLTPVIWRTDRLSENMQFVADINPLYHFIELLRAPLLGTPIETKHWIFSILSLAIGSAVTFVFFARYRSRIPYWL